MTLVDLAMELPGTHPTVVLQELDAPGRRLSFPIGYPEGIAIAYARRGLSTPRPLTHELFADVLQQVGIGVELVEITARQGSIYLAQMTMTSPTGHQVVVPCRPSDGLALALRQQLPPPVMVNEALLSPAGPLSRSTSA